MGRSERLEWVDMVVLGTAESKSTWWGDGEVRGGDDEIAWQILTVRSLTH